MICFLLSNLFFLNNSYSTLKCVLVLLYESHTLAQLGLFRDCFIANIIIITSTSIIIISTIIHVANNDD